MSRRHGCQARLKVWGVALLLAAAGIRAEEAVPIKPAPAFIAQTLDGQAISLEQFKGKVVVLNFWGTWCGPCRKETPDLVAVQRQLAGQGLVVIGAAMEQGNEDAIKAFAEQYAVNYPLVIANPSMRHDYGVIVAPTTFVIDPNGVIKFRRVGAIAKAELIRWVTGLLS